MTAGPTPEGATGVSVEDAKATEDSWVTIVWDDPVNLMTYVTRVFQQHFGWTRERAERHMMEVHNNGKSAVSSGGREQMEIDVQAMHGYGLWATLQRSGE